uniref:Uncharacterized protein n=1 Tax=Tetranychus urticae TaxID=32264 RepID=T1L4S3_TETUR
MQQAQSEKGITYEHKGIVSYHHLRQSKVDNPCHTRNGCICETEFLYSPFSDTIIPIMSRSSRFDCSYQSQQSLFYADIIDHHRMRIEGLALDWEQIIF